MAMELATQLQPEPFKCNRKGDSEQLMQDFIQYRDRMEMFFTAVHVVGAHTGDPAGGGTKNILHATLASRRRASW